MSKWSEVRRPMTPERRARVDAIKAALTLADGDLTLDEAWALAEASLPDGWYISNVRRRSPGGRVSASATQHGTDTGVNVSGFGHTPVQALLALAARATELLAQP